LEHAGERVANDDVIFEKHDTCFHGWVVVCVDEKAWAFFRLSRSEAVFTAIRDVCSEGGA